MDHEEIEWYMDQEDKCRKLLGLEATYMLYSSAAAIRRLDSFAKFMQIKGLIREESATLQNMILLGDDSDQILAEEIIKTKLKV